MNSKTYKATAKRQKDYSEGFQEMITNTSISNKWSYCPSPKTFLYTHLVLVFCLLLFSASCFAQLTFHITKVPSNTPPDAIIHLAGGFNGWNAGDTELQFTKNEDGTYSLSKDLAVGLLEFKLTRGTWETVEGNENGNVRPNREFNYDGNPQTLELEILSWEDLGNGGVLNLPPNVHIVDESFYMPQLDRNRRIWIYLPPDYNTATEKNYRTLYMHDGQNLFMSETSFAGEWEIDETLTELFEQGDEGCIVVGIDNSKVEGQRIDEYSPWVNVSEGGGEGDEYADFLVTTLKPFIDENYRTKAEREHTGIMGSSMGGLISHYTALEYPEIFSKAGIFSPAYWFSGEAYTHVLASGHPEEMRICFLAGSEEDGGSVVIDVENMYQTFLEVGYGIDEVKNVAKADGKHEEAFWAREFGESYKWLFEVDLGTDIEENTTQNLILFYPNPVTEKLFLNIPSPFKKGTLSILTIEGKIIQQSNFTNKNNQFDLQKLDNGFYFLQVTLDNKSVRTQRMILAR
ncbi:MAG: alpha/beta hydrolase-fold protein [Chitinophagales bacterium]